MPQGPTTTELKAALRGLDYPAPRAKLLTVAHLNRASPEAISRILELPETADFLNEEQLHRALGVTVLASIQQLGVNEKISP